MQKEEVRRVESPSVAQREEDEGRCQVGAGEARARPRDRVVYKCQLRRRLKRRNNMQIIIANRTLHNVILIYIVHSMTLP